MIPFQVRKSGKFDFSGAPHTAITFRAFLTFIDSFGFVLPMLGDELIVHLVAGTHDDVGWLKTAEVRPKRNLGRTDSDLI